MRLRAFLPIQHITQPAKAPAAPVAELTSVDSPPPFGVLEPKLEIPSSADVESGCDPPAEPDRRWKTDGEPSWQCVPRAFGRPLPRPEMLVLYTPTRDQNETTVKGSNEYFSLSTNAPATSPIDFPARPSTSNEVAHAIQTMRAVTRAGGKLTFNALAQEDPTSCVLSECWAKLTNENDRDHANRGSESD